jgi:two-component system, chemotaxis family, protein-glutamate methylesterase/glutaminase
MAQDELGKKRILLIGGSAGSLEVIMKIISEMPFLEGLVIVVIVHRKNTTDSILLELLSGKTNLAVKEVEDKMPITPSTVFIAPSDYHLLFEDSETFSLDASEKIHFSRPSIDVSFQSASEVFKDQTIAVLLSGANADGTEGLKSIREFGGMTIVQSPESSDVSFMPQEAINAGVVDIIIHAHELPSLLKKIFTD